MKYDKVYRTRFDVLGYVKVDRKTWIFVSLEDPEDPHQVGAQYASRAELLADADRYARNAGGSRATHHSHRGRAVQPDVDGRCGTCGASGFTYNNGHEHASDGRRGYRCMSCGDIKPEGWRKRAKRNGTGGDIIK